MRQGKCKRITTLCHQNIQQMYGRHWFSRSCLLSDLRPYFNGKKWYWSSIINALNLGFLYFWWLHQLCTKPKGDQKSFCQGLVQVELMKAHNKVPRPGPSLAITDEVRFDSKRHYPAPGPVRKCALCKKNCLNMCEKCNKSLQTKLWFQVFCE